MKLAQIALTTLLSAAIAFGVASLVAAPSAQTAQKKETAFERVMRTQTLRCAYPASVAPRIITDPNTGERSGINYEIMEAIGEALHLKIEWAEEVGYSTFTENLRSGKEDAFCSTVWTSSARAHKVLLTSPLYYVPLYVFVREGDIRFDNNLDLLNIESVSFAVMDGTTLEAVAKTSFPKAKHQSVPANADHTQPVMDVAVGKADAVVYDQFNVLSYNRRNPEKTLRRVPSETPVRTYGEPFVVAMGEWELREMLNTAISELQNNGKIDGILRKYETESGKFMRASDPFSPSKK